MRPNPEALALPFDTSSSPARRASAGSSPRPGRGTSASTRSTLAATSPAVVDDSADLETTREAPRVGASFIACRPASRPRTTSSFRAPGRRALVDSAALRDIADSPAPPRPIRQRIPDLCRVINTRTSIVRRSFSTIRSAQGAKSNRWRYRCGRALQSRDDPRRGYRRQPPVMSEETFFGPIRRFLTYSRSHEAPRSTRRATSPRAVCLRRRRAARSTADPETTRAVPASTTPLIHFANHNLSRSGASGRAARGNYHGSTASRRSPTERAVLRQGRIDLLQQFYPPYTAQGRRMLT